MDRDTVEAIESGERKLTRKLGLDYLTQCADRNGGHWYGGYSWDANECPSCNGTNDAGHLYVPCSPYGRNAADVAPVAWRYAYIVARETGEELTLDDLDHAMSLVVNDSDDVRYMIRTYGGYKYV